MKGEWLGWGTQVPLFTQKATLFPGSTFVVGYDTAIRLVMPKYYGGEVPMLLEFERLKALGCKFVVAGRVDADGSFKTMRDVILPPSLEVCLSLPIRRFSYF